MTTHTVTSTEFCAPEVVPIHWFYSLLGNVPSGIRSIVLEMLTGLIPDDAQNNTKPLNLLLALDKRITHPNEWLRIWTPVDAEFEKTPGFTNAIQTFELFEQAAKAHEVQKCFAALSETIETLWARNGTTLRRRLVVYELETPAVSIELASAAHAIIEHAKLRGANPMDTLSNIVEQLNGQRRCVDEPISAWSTMVSKLPPNIQLDATCRLCALIAYTLTPPHSIYL